MSGRGNKTATGKIGTPIRGKSATRGKTAGRGKTATPTQGKTATPTQGKKATQGKVTPGNLGETPTGTGATKDTAFELDSSDEEKKTQDKKEVENKNMKLGLVFCNDDDKIEHISVAPATTTGFNLPRAAGAGSLNSLHALQDNMQEWLPSVALITAMETLKEQILPPSMRGQVYVSNWEGAHFMLEDPTPDEAERNFQKLLQQVRIDPLTGAVGGNRQLRQVRERPWSILTVNVNDNHWATVVIALVDKRDDMTSNKDYYNRVERISVLEGLEAGFKGPQKTAIYARVEALLRTAGLQFPTATLENSWRQPIWVPEQEDAFSCGVRAYANIKTMLRRLAKAWEAMETDEESLAVRPPSATTAENRFLWDPMPGWFHYELERWEMIGSNAAAVVRGCDYQARVAVEVVQRARGPRDDPGQTSDAETALNLPDNDAYSGWPDDIAQTVRWQNAGIARMKKTPEPGPRPVEVTPTADPTRTERNKAMGKWAGVAVWLNPPPTVRRGGTKRPREADVIDLTGDDDGNGGAVPISFNRTRTDTNHYTNPFATRQSAPKSVMVRTAPAAKRRRTRK
ncbi:hypothetical protein PG993_012013 [Apiospora rasikravindrae]|uniref:Ubiquitin-like protease family profile domain-containing protein n=1 Tax=Apiospora rasikravindrae TaxID=990691 RepID=A0ABR1S2M9_9PEZI